MVGPIRGAGVQFWVNCHVRVGVVRKNRIRECVMGNGSNDYWGVRLAWPTGSDGGDQKTKHT